LFFVLIEMVGMFRKVSQLLKFVQQFSPTINKIVPGLGSLLSIGAGVGNTLAEGVGGVYDHFQESKRSKQKYGIKEGIKSFAEGIQTAVK
jgi:hypothetical protein